MHASFPRAIAPSDPDAGQCRQSKVESATRSATFGVRAPAPASRGHNLHTPSNNVEQRPNESLPIRDAAGESTELPPQTISGAFRCGRTRRNRFGHRSEEHTSELQSQSNLVCRLLLEKK